MAVDVHVLVSIPQRVEVGEGAASRDEVPMKVDVGLTIAEQELVARTHEVTPGPGRTGLWVGGRRCPPSGHEQAVSALEILRGDENVEVAGPADREVSVRLSRQSHSLERQRSHVGIA